MKPHALMLLTTLSAGLPLVLHAAAEGTHAHHAHHAQPSEGAAVAADEVPPLRIILPENGAKVGTQLAVVFETPGDLGRLTMSAPVIGTHLHIETEGVSLMPTADQLIALGGGRYLFVFDLPVAPGERRLRVYWSDGMHRTIDASMQTVKLTVEAAHGRPK
ncbi:hypothetical protein [Solimonas sp. SE-A11]|uniref:hypothetical protein n=1 Tax=Solimonas sp. SE-A11 TaxID=3054954 RepID=UPI00259CA703|nr:hypothetical protein [Solimonas sp. SE-A11]MDM4771501.1 hypothetical protein [Solimonas sp. SE-A11]